MVLTFAKKNYDVNEKYCINGTHYFEIFRKGSLFGEFEDKRPLNEIADEEIAKVVEEFEEFV